MIKTVFFSLYLTTLMSLAFGVSINKCSDGGLVPEKVVVDGCEEDTTICKLKFNDVLNITVEFKAPYYMESIKSEVIGKTIFGNFPLAGKTAGDDVCRGILNTFCPIVEKELVEYRYSGKLAVLPLLPITVEFSILDMQLNETTVCFNLNVSPTF